MEYGDLLQDLYIRHNNTLNIQIGNGTQKQFFNNNGNLNSKIKSIVKSNTPSSSSNSGFYYDGQNFYINDDGNVINVTEKQFNLPEGSVIMYSGQSAPSNWNNYNNIQSEINDVIYITNGN